ncbi:DUF3800 domain-containing protein [Vagococcus sp. JNUCC 83]
MSFSYFIDESGNTGTNWLDDIQKNFVYGGWIVEDSSRDEIEKYISAELKKQQGPEFKSSKMFKSVKGAENALFLLNYMVEKKCVPFFIITEKKFMVAAKIVESFFDYAYNPNVNVRLTHPHPIKRALANCIMENDNYQLMEDFLYLIKNGTISLDEIRNINDKLITLFKESNFEEVSASLEGIPDDGLLKLVDEFESVSNFGKDKTKLTLTEPYLHTLFSKLNLFANNILDSKISIIHDELRGYKQIFIEFEQFFGGVPNSIKMINGNPMLGNYFMLDSLEMQTSLDELLLQMSDLLIGFVNHSLKKWRMREDININQKNFWNKLIELHKLYFDEKNNPVEIWSFIMSNEMEVNFLNSLDIYKRITSKEEDIEIINNDYYMFLSKLERVENELR